MVSFRRVGGNVDSCRYTGSRLPHVRIHNAVLTVVRGNFMPTTYTGNGKEWTEKEVLRWVLYLYYRRQNLVLLSRCVISTALSVTRPSTVGLQGTTEVHKWSLFRAESRYLRGQHNQWPSTSVRIAFVLWGPPSSRPRWKTSLELPRIKFTHLSFS